MKFSVLRYFVVLAEELHFGRAAARLAITQPPLSLAIKALERELGVELFVRTSKAVRLTTAGVAFLDEARRILTHVERAAGIARSTATGVRGFLDVAITSSLLYREPAAIFRAFAASAGTIELQLTEMSTREQLQALPAGRIHAGFLHVSAVPAGLQGVALRKDELVLCLPASDPRARLAALDLRSLADDKFIMFAREVSPVSYDNVIALLTSSGIHPHTIHTAQQWPTSIAMVANGLGITVVPRSLARAGVAGVRFVPFTGVKAWSQAWLLWNPVNLPEALARFIRTARAVIAKGTRATSGGGDAAAR